MIQAIVPHTGRHLAPRVLSALAAIAREHGYDENWLHQQLAQGRKDAMEIAHQMGIRARNEFRNITRRVKMKECVLFW